MPFLHPDQPESGTLGGKGAALARLGRLGFEVPPWFAIPPACEWTAQELESALSHIGPGLYAVRSSGSSEDGSSHSFAGQFESHLDVPATEVPDRIRAVRMSSRSESILTYCRENGIPGPDTPTVLIQRMIRARCAGVAFSADPVGGSRGVVVVSAVAGTGDKLVSGEVDGEDWRIGGGSILGKPTHPACLTDMSAREVAALAIRCEQACGRPQDIEWAMDEDGKLWLLQSRPITTLAHQPDPDDELHVWDNSNIAESYGGVTTPLTFSFARRIYESVYREFCRLMSVPPARIGRADDVFPNMLGLIHGRVYYNLVSWYRVLALLPGFQINRGFMEQMMGVREPLPEEIVQRIIRENRSSRFADAIDLIRTCCGLIRRHFGIDRQIAGFQVRLDTALAPPPCPIHRMRGDELCAHYRDLERQLLKKWDAPLVNDFLAMIFYGLLRSLCTKWAGDPSGTLQNQLLLDCGDIISAEPPRRIQRMATLAARISHLPETLADPTIPTHRKLAALRAHDELAAAFESYLTEFGDRCLEELKLESPTVSDDPDSLLCSIGAMAMRPPGEETTHPAPARIPALGPVRSLVFRYVLRHARARVRCRENLRFERTRLFGRVRAILRALGERLQADGLLDRADDVFYLELGEVLAAWETTGTTENLAPLARLRRGEFAGHSAAADPPDRFETRGPLHRHQTFASTRPPEPSAGSLQGTGACPGRVTGRVRVVLDPRGARLEPGEILVARQTDPGWVVLFPAASGLLVERGSLLSHSAIVSRELRLPCIVSLPGITTTLQTGDIVEMDGTTGTVRRISPSTEPRSDTPHPP